MECDENRLAYIAALIETALHVELEGAEWANRYGLAWLSDAYNGIGPEFLPVAVREKVSKWLHVFEPAALIHDARNHVSDGTWTGFLHANKEFRSNCLKLADWNYPWYSWRRYRARAVAVALFEFVSADNFGWRAWLDAHERHLHKQQEETT